MMTTQSNHRCHAHSEGIITREEQKEWVLYWKSARDHRFEQSQYSNDTNRISLDGRWMLDSEKALISDEVNRAWDTYLEIISASQEEKPAAVLPSPAAGIGAGAGASDVNEGCLPEPQPQQESESLGGIHFEILRFNAMAEQGNGKSEEV